MNMFIKLLPFLLLSQLLSSAVVNSHSTTAGDETLNIATVESHISRGPLSILDTTPGKKERSLPKISEILKKSANAEKTIYLTFDDGPMRGTENILKVLSEENVKATMFCVGRNIARHPSLFKRELVLPNIMVANHTYSHANGHYSRFYSDLWGVMSDVEHAQLIVGGRKYLRLAGRNVWRTPDIRRDDRALSPHRVSVEMPKYDTLADEGFFVYGWDIEWHFGSGGRRKGGAQELASRIESLYRSGRTVKRGKVVLLAHDFMFRDNGSTDELRRFIKIMKSRGWRFETIEHYSSQMPEVLRVAKYYGRERQHIARLKKEQVKIAIKDILDVEKSIGAKEAKKSVAAHRERVVEKSPQRVLARRIDRAELNDRLVDAIFAYDSQKVDMLIRKGASINIVDTKGRTPLNSAVKANSIFILKKLIAFGADLNLRDRAGYTPLLLARKYKRVAIEKYLIEIMAIDRKETRIAMTPKH
jgi:peptidoglycan/xylan/chitin deacetylase (PgdA/CDA1 family)